MDYYLGMAQLITHHTHQTTIMRNIKFNSMHEDIYKVRLEFSERSIFGSLSCVCEVCRVLDFIYKQKEIYDNRSGRSLASSASLEITSSFLYNPSTNSLSAVFP